MSKLAGALIVCIMFSIACVRDTSIGMGHTETYVASNEAELKAGVQRINDFKQELLGRGLRVISNGSTGFSTGDEKGTTRRGSKETVVLKGDYGKLRDIEVTLWTSDSLAVDPPRLGAGIKARFGKAEEDEANALRDRLRFVVTGYK